MTSEKKNYGDLKSFRHISAFVSCEALSACFGVFLCR